MRNPGVVGALVLIPLLSACVVVGDDAPASTSASSETRGDGDGDPGDGDGDPHADCVAPDPTFAMSYSLEGLGMLGAQVQYTWTCVTTSVSTDGGLQLSLDCPEAPGPIQIDITTSPGISTDLGIGTEVELHYTFNHPWWSNLYLRLDIGGSHFLTLIDGDSLDAWMPGTFELPYAITSESDLCGYEVDFCADWERHALRIETESASAMLFDHHHGVVGPPAGTEVWVDSVGAWHNIDCTDSPQQWYRLLIVDSGGA